MQATQPGTNPAAPPDAPARHCPACDYSLLGLPISGTCPECGIHYDASSGSVLTPADKVALAPRCHHCLYNLSGLPAAGPCPECGRPYDTADGPPPSLAEQIDAFPGRLSIGLRDAKPWFGERFLPSAHSAAVILLVLGTATLLIWIAWESMRAVFNKFAVTNHGHRPTGTQSMPLTIGRAIADAAVFLAHALPYALVVAALVIAHEGIQHKRVHLSPTLTLTGTEARSLGRFALYSGLALAAFLFWSSLSA
ncbi:MAG: hypothetical protein Q8L55_13340 [Phycisphaerales bacterium]|nr:hypothetical protein [Phycisphaerales bacterium]